MCIDLAKWANEDSQYSTFNFPLIQAAAAFAIIEFFFPFLHIVGTGLCIAIFVLYREKTDDQKGYIIILSISIVDSVLQLTGWIVFIASESCAVNAVLNSLLDPTDSEAALAACLGGVYAGVIIFVITLFSFGIVRAIYVFDLLFKVQANFNKAPTPTPAN